MEREFAPDLLERYPGIELSLDGSYGQFNELHTSQSGVIR